LINHTQSTPLHIKQQNKNTHERIVTEYVKSNTDKLQFYCVLIENMPQKHAGAGLARKIAMDEAIRRFIVAGKSDGVIVSLDADTLVPQNYFIDIEKAFDKNKKLNCTILNFKHSIPYASSKELEAAITLYELYLHYFKQALKYTGFPYAYHTIGSCFAVKASVYVKQGGMNRRQGGEDFYFLHKVFPLGNTIELNSVTVYPSARVSDRVPFGTGPAVKEIMEQDNYFTYRFEYFTYLKYFFSNINYLYKAGSKDIIVFYENLDLSLKEFIPVDTFISKISEINANSASVEKFKQRFFYWFDAFKVIKYLNFVHKKVSKITVISTVNKYIIATGVDKQTEKPEELLAILRNL
jgi:hypothetical protein